MLSKNATCYPESHIPGFIYMPGLTAMICLQHIIIQGHTKSYSCAELYDFFMYKPQGHIMKTNVC